MGFKSNEGSYPCIKNLLARCLQLVSAFTNTIGKEALWLSLFSLLFSAGIIAGRHISASDPYSGLISENFFIPFSLGDLISYIILSVCFFVIFGILHILAEKFDREKEISESRIHIFPVCIVILVLWSPYLYAYWPGFIFGDTKASILQAVGSAPLDNRNPLLYTLFIKLCVFISGGLRTGDLTNAFAIYSIFQMVYVSVCISYLICRITLGMKSILKWLLALTYGLSPYVAAFTIAAWKDPVFSASVAVYSVLLFDFARSNGKVIREKKWIAAYACMSLIILFWRNNGICAVGASMLFLLVFYAVSKKAELKRALLKITAISAAVLILWGSIWGPVYHHFNIGTPKEETAGIMLNQMACVAAYGGNMSANDAEYMNSILPLELYPELYRPCCVDLLKWDSRLNYDAMYDGSFLKTWVSLGLKNPKLYIQAWAMETYGFWTVNKKEINLNTANINLGSLTNKDIAVGEYTIRCGNFAGSEWLRSILPADSWSVPVGIINWAILFFFLSVIRRGNPLFSIVFISQLGISAGLVIASPIFYLPRYGASAQFLIPLYLLVAFRSNTTLSYKIQEPINTNQ